ncbi:FRG domain-containing protein [Bacillus toyonensis]|uniref:FRG domain-containing protein n=1 Tax=Bacillus toyonensis TaxID=155322 RepID=UPI000BF1D54A|nr:FRG domain-containing protein [Bacillus toyonensis]PEN44507.1 FRG domain-containing protein [Bacillus toyonensis]
MRETVVYPQANKIFSEDWNYILNEIASFRRSSMTNWIWFRGHSKDTYTLDSGLFRIENKKLTIEHYLSLEKRLFTSFKNQSPTFIREDFWDVHFHMQHHGLKTRLLDWTESFGTALYFAFEGWDYDSDNNACIWLLDPFALNKYFHDTNVIFTTDSFKIDYECDNLLDVFNDEIISKLNDSPFKANSFAIFPAKNNPRLLLQNGYFTVQSNNLEDLEEEIKRVCPENKDLILKKIILSPKLVEDVYEYLTINGVNRFTVFNDADGLSTYLNKELTETAFNPRLRRIAKF